MVIACKIAMKNQKYLALMIIYAENAIYLANIDNAVLLIMRTHVLNVSIPTFI